MNEIVIIITAVTGLIGTTAGVLISYLSLRHTFRKDKYKVRIKIKESMLAWQQPGTTKPRIQKNMLTYNLANIGFKDFTVVSLGIEVGRRSGGLFINDPIGTVKTPYILKSGETCAFWGEFESIKSKIDKPKLHNKIKIRAYTSDYLGNTFKSNWMTIRFKESLAFKLNSWISKTVKSFLSVLWP